MRISGTRMRCLEDAGSHLPVLESTRLDELKSAFEADVLVIQSPDRLNSVPVPVFQHHGGFYVLLAILLSSLLLFFSSSVPRLSHFLFLREAATCRITFHLSLRYSVHPHALPAKF